MRMLTGVIVLSAVILGCHSSESNGQVVIEVGVPTNNVRQLDPLIVRCRIVNTGAEAVVTMPPASDCNTLHVNVKFPHGQRFIQARDDRLATGVGAAHSYRPNETNETYMIIGTGRWADNDNVRSGFVFTRTGEYSIRVEGQVNGTSVWSNVVDVRIAPRETEEIVEIAAMDAVMREAFTKGVTLEETDTIKLRRVVRGGILGRYLDTAELAVRVRRHGYSREVMLKTVVELVGRNHDIVSELCMGAMIREFGRLGDFQTAETLLSELTPGGVKRLEVTRFLENERTKTKPTENRI